MERSPMADKPPLAKSELEVARIVWQLGRATVREVFEALPKDREIDFFTVQTYLRRLEAKGYLQVERDGRKNVYSPRQKPGRVVRDLLNDFLARLFDGEVAPLFQHLIRDRGLTDEEIESLQAELDRWKEKRS
jgi:predicted transcriptional regulator